MNDRERLIELIDSVAVMRLSEVRDLADYLISRGVTFERHGRWIFKHNPITDPKGYFIRIVCSECNLHTGQKSNYCPNCGAKMDEGEA